MKGLIENKNWSAQENETIQSILIQLMFDEEKKGILQQQIQKMKSAEKVITYLLGCNQNWEILQSSIQKETSNYEELEQQKLINQISLNQLTNIKIQIQQKIKSPQQTNRLIQYIQQKNFSQEVINNALSQDFKSIQEFQSIIYKIDPKQKNIEQCFINQNNQTLNRNNPEWYDQIQELLKEFQSLNKRLNKQNFDLLQEIYNSIKKYPITYSKNDDFSKSPNLQLGDLLLLCARVYEHFSFYPRPVQLLSVLELYNHNEDKGRLAQIYTGEGKSLIIAMLAILLCKKKNQNVDIVTSSPVLAIRDSQELAKFYELFKVSVTHNIHKSIEQNERRVSCYTFQVIYGDPHSFQGDILSHEYSESGIMLERKQEYIIVDEVDSMLIDGNSNKTILSSSNPGMLDLTKVLGLIWDEICKVEKQLSTDMKVMMIVGQDYYSVDLQEYLENTLNIQIQDVLKNYLPRFRLNYINFMKKIWIENAIEAKFHLHEKKHYLIDNQIRIIDYQNTGVVHKVDMQWQKGLHQFLQLKHNLPITPLRISTNFMSNVGFFKRYNNKLLGLTGTLGSQVTQDLLAKQYNLDFAFMPPYKKRLLKEETGIATLTKDEWFQEILKAVELQMRKGRAVLIINQTIDDVNKIEDYLKKQKINSITYIDDNQELKKEIGPQTIIIATNLAGRGTDLTTNEELEKNGGLHVIMSFLPRNIRIQLQGFGRTARQGKQGTAQLIVHFSSNLYVGQIKEIKIVSDAISYYQQYNQTINYTYIDVLLFFRDLNEQQYSNEIEERMNKLLNEDKCFQKFCQIAKKQVCIKTDKPAFRALEEKWGLYLEEHQDDGLDEDDIEEKLNSDETQNPKYLVQQGIDKGNIKLFEKAIQIAINDPIPEYYKACQQIKMANYKEGAETFIKARQLFQDKINDDQGFLTVAKLNKLQVQSSQQIQQKPDLQQSERKISNDKKVMPKLDLQGDSQNQNKSVSQNIQKNEQLDALEQKIKNHNKVYQKAIDSIDQILNTLQTQLASDEHFELGWIPVINESKEKNAESEQYIKDQQEVVDDGPLPKLGRLYKIKKKKSIFDSILMFFLGAAQLVIGCAMCVFTCGAALPLARTLIAEGISDMVYAIKSAWQGIAIDWGAWGQNKVIKIATTLGLAGPDCIREALIFGGSKMKSIKKVEMTEFINKIPPVTVEGLEKSCFWLTQNEKVNISNQYETLRQISDVTQNAYSNTQILELANQVLCNQVNLNNISQETYSQILDLVKLCFQQSKYNVVGFKNIFCQMAQNYIQLQIAKSKQGYDITKIKGDLIEICQRESDKKYNNNVKNEIQQFNQYKQALNNELMYFYDLIIDIYKKDEEIQKQTLVLDLFYEKLCDQQKVKKIFTNNTIQAIIRQNFCIHNKQVQNACKKLQISNPHSNRQFYQVAIRPSIQQLCRELNVKEYTEPLEIILQMEFINQFKQKVEQQNVMIQKLNYQIQNIEYQVNQIKGTRFAQVYDIERVQQLIDNHKTQVDQLNQQIQLIKELGDFDYQHYLREMVNHLKNKGMLNNMDSKFSSQLYQELNKYMIMKKYFSTFLIESIIQVFRCSLSQMSNLQSRNKKILTSKLLLAIEVEIIDEIKKYLFESRIQTLENKIANLIS
ncbi:unnamed protein product (macronuclear) [Paramecium tetraurelia]|uniref:Uncharacterized protein n=1 Tax=Paramecium tetraurelia TaxID=5888 RepID=A0D836_PARTE|nr:uncharacterized protein GSPATT00014170001 [Paramecium tetraurelia]CAK79203.1 unnamed protein product [Paramecium tetraurelia]|eukprot:XP_001446600.1 hypothetical protein (macronuclear) [Paramecium tetraurelia strain d4-2]